MSPWIFNKQNWDSEAVCGAVTFFFNNQCKEKKEKIQEEIYRLKKKALN